MKRYLIRVHCIELWAGSFASGKVDLFRGDGDGVCDDCDICPGYDDAEPCPIPTVSQWGVIVMFLLTLTAGCVVIRRQSMVKISRL